MVLTEFTNIDPTIELWRCSYYICRKLCHMQEGRHEVVQILLLLWRKCSSKMWTGSNREHPLALTRPPSESVGAVGDKNRISGWPLKGTVLLVCTITRASRLLFLPPASTLISCSDDFSILWIEAICSSETSGDFQRTTSRYISEDSTLWEPQILPVSLGSRFSSTISVFPFVHEILFINSWNNRQN
jgi:hypothetical protein